MKRTKVDMTPELKILTNLIVSDRFCREIIPVLYPNTLKSEYVKIVVKWVIEYYEKFQKAPYKNMTDIFRSKKKSIRDDGWVESIADFLLSLSSNWENTKPNNVQYSIEEALIYLKLCAGESLSEQIMKAAELNDATRMEQAISNFKRVERPFGEGVSLLHDAGEIASAFIDDEESLFHFKGIMGDIIGDAGRGDFISFLAPMKRGKTFMLWYTAETAMYSGCKVVFFTLEMTKKQMTRRGWQSLVGQPRKTSVVNIPHFEEIENSDPTKYTVVCEQETRDGIDLTKIKEQQSILKRQFRKGDVRIIALPAYSASVEDINARLDNLEHYDNYIPDVIVIDYADIVAPSKGFKGEYRHQIDDIWKRLRRMAQERNILMVTASQAEKSSFRTDITELHVAEDIRKLAHVTCMVAINQSKQEAEMGIARLSQIGIREGRKQFKQAVMLQCLDIGRPCMDVKFKDDVIIPTEKEEEEERPNYRKRHSKNR